MKQIFLNDLVCVPFIVYTLHTKVNTAPSTLQTKHHKDDDPTKVSGDALNTLDVSRSLAMLNYWLRAGINLGHFCWLPSKPVNQNEETVCPWCSFMLSLLNNAIYTWELPNQSSRNTSHETRGPQVPWSPEPWSHKVALRDNPRQNISWLWVQSYRYAL